MCAKCRSALGVLVCSRCLTTRYCSPGCQRAAWPLHKAACNAAPPAPPTPEGFEMPPLSPAPQDGGVDVRQALGGYYPCRLQSPPYSLVDVVEEVPDAPGLCEAILNHRDWPTPAERVPGTGLPTLSGAKRSAAVAYVDARDLTNTLCTVVDVADTRRGAKLALLVSHESPATMARNVLIFKVLSELGPKVSMAKALETSMFLVCVWGSNKLPPAFAARLSALLLDAPTWLPKSCMAFTPGTQEAVTKVFALWEELLRGTAGPRAALSPPSPKVSGLREKLGRQDPMDWVMSEVSPHFWDPDMAQVIIGGNRCLGSFADRFVEHDGEMELPSGGGETGAPGSWTLNPMVLEVTRDGRALSSGSAVDAQPEGEALAVVARLSACLVRGARGLERLKKCEYSVQTHPLTGAGMFLVQSGRAIQGLLSKGLLTVRMDCGPVSCLPSRLPPADLGTFDVVDANNKGDTVTTTIMLIVASQLLRAGSGLMVGEVLANCSMWSTLAHQLQSTCHVMSVAELEGVTGMRLIGGNVMSRHVFKHMGGGAKRLEYAVLMAYVTALLVDSAVPAAAAYNLYLMMQVVHTHPVTVSGVFRVIHHLISARGYPAHWFAKFFGPLPELRRATGTMLKRGSKSACLSRLPSWRAKDDDKPIPVVHMGPCELELSLQAAKWAPSVGLPTPAPAPTTVRVLIHLDAGRFVYTSVMSSSESFGRTDQNSLGVLMAPRRLLMPALRGPVGLRKLVVGAMLDTGVESKPAPATIGEGGAEGSSTAGSGGSVGEPVQDRVHVFGSLAVEARPEGSATLVHCLDAHSYDFSVPLPLDALQGMLLGTGDGEMLVQTFSTMPWRGMGDPVPLRELRVLA